MRFIVGLVTGLIAGIALYILWRKVYRKYLPMEDAFLLSFISGAAYVIAGMISGALCGSLNKYACYAGIIITVLVLIVSHLFGVYYRHIATKSSKF